MSRHLLGNLEDETPNVFVNNGCKKQGRGMVGLFLVAFFVVFMNGMALAQTTITSLSTIASDPSGNYIITANIDATGFTSSIASFTGTLTAQAFTSGDHKGEFPVISNLSHPIFVKVTGATISNIMLKDVTISQDGSVGAICDTANGTTRIYNCGILPTTTLYDNKGKISGFEGSNIGSTDSYCGGLVGYLDGYARVINCFSYANITGGTEVAGIVGYNTTATMQGNNQTNFNNNVKTMVMNCMFYGDITGGTTKYPVYGGSKFNNTGSNGVNNYNYFYEAASFDDDYELPEQFQCSWQVPEKYLNRFEFYRSILNSNRRLCAWWVNGTFLNNNDAQTDAEVEAVGIAKWVLDKTIAPFPILKKWGKYPSIINIDTVNVYNPRTNTNMARSNANEWEGKRVGTLLVTIQNGLTGSNASTVSKKFVVTDMDTLNFDYCAKKIQLPYYNEIFGNPTATDWTVKYGGNYHNKRVVTGWKITAVTDGTPGTFVGYASPDGSFTPDVVSTNAWEDGFNFADRKCTNKDLYAKSGRVFAQGGFYYVPEGVTAITIEAYWGDAVYLCNNNRRLDRVNNGGNDFYVSGKLPDKVNGESNQVVQTSLSNAVGALKKLSDDGCSNYTVYDQAIVLVGNYHQNDFHTNILLNGSYYDSNAKPFTIMSVDFDFDNEPDFCFEVGMKDAQRPNVHPIRFDFLPVPDITMAIRIDNNYFGMRIFCPQGHFEITETSFMYTTQFEYDQRVKYLNYNNNQGWAKREAPVILNGGEFFQIVSAENGSNTWGFSGNSQTATQWGADKTSYFILGGHFWMKAFTPGTHGNDKVSTRHCAVNVMGGEFEEFYLSGMFRTDFYNKTDNPHCYTNGGKFGLIAGAGMESVGGQNEIDGGNVTFIIDRSLINEFYGGGINAERPVTGNINVTCNNSFVHKYCGGPRLGDMSSTKSITNNATGTYFGNFYGGGNGGTNMLRVRRSDSGSAISPPSKTNHIKWDRQSSGNGQGETNYGGYFTYFSESVLGQNSANGYNANNGYLTEYEFELLPQPSGKSTVVMRSYFHWAKFAQTLVAPVTSTLKDCTVLHDFYGGGYLGKVGGSVVSTLEGNTHVYGSAYGGGYSASIPSFPIHNPTTVQYAYPDTSGYIHDGSLDYLKYTVNVGTHRIGDTIYYQWIDAAHIPANWSVSPTISNPLFQDPTGNGKWYCYTTAPLNDLGAISGDATLTIKDNTVVYNNVYGGGNESEVIGNTSVFLTDRTKVFGNIYGGGNRGKVGGDTIVIVNGERGQNNNNQGQGSGNQNPDD